MSLPPPWNPGVLLHAIRFADADGHACCEQGTPWNGCESLLCMLQPTVIEDLLVGGTAGAAAAAATTPLDVVKTV